MINLNNKQFKGVSNSADGEVSSETVFTYYQEGSIIWGSYGGGSILKGTLMGTTIDDKEFHFNYCHVNQDHELLSGHCQSKIEMTPSGKLRIHESWAWSGGKSGSGTSIIEEL